MENSTHYVAEPLGVDRETWHNALSVALGTASPHFLDACLRRLIAASLLPDEPVASTSSLSAALALIQGMAPENEVQAALAVDAACLHAAATNVLSRVVSFGGERRVVALATAAARLERLS